jgi:hypothetical protein
MATNRGEKCTPFSVVSTAVIFASIPF